MNGRAAVMVLLGGALCLGTLGPAEGEARAAGLTVSLAYEALPGCPDAGAFKSIVISRMGRDPFREGAPDHVLVRITSRPHALDGRLEWRDADWRWSGDQTFPLITTDCARLARGMAFALAVQLQLLASTRALSDESGPAPPTGPRATPAADATGATGDRSGGGPVTPPAAPSAPASPAPAAPGIAAAAAPDSTAPATQRSTAPATPVAPDAPPRIAAETSAVPVLVSPSPAAGTRRAGPDILIGAGPAVGVGMSSAPVLLGRIFGALAWRRLSLELAAAATLPSTTRRMDGAGVAQHQLLLGAAGCGSWPRWQACLLANVGAVRMSGTDIDRPTSATVPVVEAGARVGALQQLGPRLFVSAHLDAMIVLARWTATLDQVPVWTAPRFAGAMGLDAGVRFR